MKIEFVNHASFIIEGSGTRVLCDPWLEGSVFNNGWSLISPTKFTYEDFKDVDYIWFSHEHPDHFYPPNLKLIPSDYKKKITILYQHTPDQRVVNYCAKQGFKRVFELYPDQWFQLADNFKVLSEHFTEGDSWICFKGNSTTFLNTNDCGIRNERDAHEIKKKVGAVDVLFTQFSYAYWAGNPDEKEYRQRIADEKLDWLKFQCDIFQPMATIPIASYIYFSHEENFYLNDSINTPRKTYEFIKQNTASQPVILYNGETYNFPESHDSATSIARYENDFKVIKSNPVCEETKKISEENLISAAVNFIDDMNAHNYFYLKMFLHATNIYVKDYEQAYKLSLRRFAPVEIAEQRCDVSLTSENLEFCFRFPYGLDTTQINGRLRKPKGGNYSRFYNYFRINQYKSRGVNPNNLVFMWTAIFRKFLNRIGLRKV